MSITSALSNALSGLSASSRAAEIASSNLANVLTDGYAPRSLELSSRAGPAGVQVDGIQRHVDQGLIGDRRLASGEAASANVRATFLMDIERAIGLPGDEASLFAQISEFEASLVTAASRPDDTIRLHALVDAADQVANSFTDVSDRIQALRTKADADIGQAVETVNLTLSQVQSLNERIVAAQARGQPVAGLHDQRQVLLDDLATYLPIRQIERDNGAVALFTTGGLTLLDGKAARLEFHNANVVAPHMTADQGLLSGLRINGVDVETFGNGSPIAGGKLSGLFEVRDSLSVTAQARLDSLARNLVERFQDPAMDATRPSGASGLFTDDGALFDPMNEVGLAGRLSLNMAVDPQRGGQVWRMRDGLGAALPGVTGDATLLQQMQDALGQVRPLGSGDLPGTPQSFSAHLANLSSRMGQERLMADQSLTFANANQAELTAQEKQMGVDTDAEMQRLLPIEQIYAANAKMVQTIDDMMQTLLRI